MGSHQSVMLSVRYLLLLSAHASLPPLSSTVAEQELLRLLGTHQVEQLECSWHRPMYIVNSLARIVRSIPDGPTFTSRERLAMLALLNDFSSCVGACERIVQTPVPLSYARHTSRFLTLWLWTLPWVGATDCHRLLCSKHVDDM